MGAPLAVQSRCGTNLSGAWEWSSQLVENFVSLQLAENFVSIIQNAGEVGLGGKL